MLYMLRRGLAVGEKILKYGMDAELHGVLIVICVTTLTYLLSLCLARPIYI